MKNKVGKVILQFTFFNFQALKMGKEDRFIASISALDGAPKFIHNSFKLGTDSLSQTTGKKLTLLTFVIFHTSYRWIWIVVFLDLKN